MIDRRKSRDLVRTARLPHRDHGHSSGVSGGLAIAPGAADRADRRSRPSPSAGLISFLPRTARSSLGELLGLRGRVARLEEPFDSEAAIAPLYGGQKRNSRSISTASFRKRGGSLIADSPDGGDHTG
jgi:hypothetical protein